MIKDKKQDRRFKKVHFLNTFNDVRDFLKKQDCHYIRRYFINTKQFYLFRMAEGFDVNILETLKPYFCHKIKDDFFIVAKNVSSDVYENPLYWDFNMESKKEKTLIKVLGNYYVRFNYLQQCYYVMDRYKSKIVKSFKLKDDAIKWLEDKHKENEFYFD